MLFLHPCIRSLPEGPVLDPSNYRMVAVSGTMYRLYVNVLRVYVTDQSLTHEWCQRSNKNPDTQFGYYPGQNTIQPMFILRHLPVKNHLEFI